MEASSVDENGGTEDREEDVEHGEVANSRGERPFVDIQA